MTNHEVTVGAKQTTYALAAKRRAQTTFMIVVNDKPLCLKPAQCARAVMSKPHLAVAECVDAILCKFIADIAFGVFAGEPFVKAKAARAKPR